jgi:tetratricopeptide (TPR) repeat protein
MSVMLQRANLLFEQERYTDAADAVRQHLASDPENAGAHRLLALCLVNQNKLQEATDHAQQAIGLDPTDPYSHYTLAAVLLKRNRYPEAQAAVQRAITIEPTFVDGYALLAQLHFAQGRWQATFDAASEGLALDPDSTSCLNMRAMAEVKLGRSKAAASTLADTLQRNPDNASAHANQGWLSLEQGDAKQAAVHFKEALRLDPTHNWARAGIVEAIKARNPIYRWLLLYFLWMAKFSGQARFGVMIGGYIGYRVLVSLAQNNPGIAPWLMPLIVLYIIFALLTWLGSPLMNLALRLHPLGRYALSDDQRKGANLTLVLLLLPLAVLGIGLSVGGSFIDAGIAALFTLLLALPGSAIYSCDSGWPRQTAWVLLGGLAAVGLPAIVVFALSLETLPPHLAAIFRISMFTYGWAVLGSQFAMNYLTSATVRK